ncbi:MAG: DUF2530 domain-containing protein [Microbacteriaceae bacterium]
MRLWLRDSERKPDPVPATTDDRAAILVGLVLWVVSLIVVIVVTATTTVDTASTNSVVDPERVTATLWTCAAGIALGVVGLIYTARRHSRTRD